MPPEFLRTPEERFAGLSGYPFAPHYHDWDGLRMHYVDEGGDGGTGPVALLLHGQPRWSYLYREFIPPLVEAGYRCVAPDYIGFGKSDKVVDDGWYVIERHIESVRSLIEALDLRQITIVAHDWGGPIGLRQVADMPERFERLVILNTWLHHLDMPYSEAIIAYRTRVVSGQWTPPGGDMAEARKRFEQARSGAPGPQQGAAHPAWAAPFPDDRYQAGTRRFPWLHPYARPAEGNALDQARCYEALKRWDKPAHVIFGEDDPIFPPSWGREWASVIPGATFDAVPGHHFVQDTSAARIVELMLGYASG
jgi:haloalkane dehalogenase